MKATITIGENELNQIIRDQVAKFKGVSKITEIKYKIEHDRHDETTTFSGAEVSVELQTT